MKKNYTKDSVNAIARNDARAKEAVAVLKACDEYRMLFINRAWKASEKEDFVEFLVEYAAAM